VSYFVITDKVLDNAPASTPSTMDSKKPSHQSKSSSTTAVSGANLSPITSPKLSSSMEQENQDDTYILLDECVSGTQSSSLKVTAWLASTPSPGNALAVRNDCLNVDISGDSKSPMPSLGFVHSPNGSLHARSSEDGAFEGTVLAQSGDTMDVDTPDGRFAVGVTSPDSMGYSKPDESEFPPALPAKMSVESFVEYAVPLSTPVHASTSHRTPVTMHGSSAAPPPRPHMAVPGRMHRYVNAAPTPVAARGQTPGGIYIQPPQQNATASALPPKPHG